MVFHNRVSRRRRPRTRRRNLPTPPELVKLPRMQGGLFRRLPPVRPHPRERCSSRRPVVAAPVPSPDWHPKASSAASRPWLRRPRDRDQTPGLPRRPVTPDGTRFREKATPGRRQAAVRPQHGLSIGRPAGAIRKGHSLREFCLPPRPGGSGREHPFSGYKPLQPASEFPPPYSRSGPAIRSRDRAPARTRSDSDDFGAFTCALIFDQTKTRVY